MFIHHTSLVNNIVHSYNKYTLFRFPLKNPSLLNSWVTAMKRANWKPTTCSVLCEKHFTPNDYAMPQTQSVKCAGQTKKYLKPDAVPSIFDFPKNLKTSVKNKKPPTKRKAPSPKKTVPIKKPKYSTQLNMQDHSYCTSPSKVIPRMKKSLEKKKKKIRALTSKNLRKEKTIKGLVKKLET